MTQLHLITRPYRDALKLQSVLSKNSHFCLINPLLKIKFYFKTLSRILKNNCSEICFIMTSINSLRAIKKFQIPNLSSINLIVSSNICYKEAQGLGFKSIILAGPKATSLIEYFISNNSKKIKYIYLCGKDITLEIDKVLSNLYLDVERIMIYEAVIQKLTFETIQHFKQQNINSVSLFSLRTAQIFINEIHTNQLQNYLASTTFFTISEKAACFIKKQLQIKEVFISDTHTNDGVAQLIIKEIYEKNNN